jgi:GLPGLI family protein
MLNRVFYILIFSLVFNLYSSQNKALNIKALYEMEIDRNNTFKSGSNPKVDCDMYIEDGISRFIVKYQEAYAIYPGQVISYNVSVYKDFNKNEMYGRAIGYKANNYVIKDSLNIIDWKLQDSTKIINGKNCKLATVHWRGFDWEAWYDEDITVSDGPFKLHGLPGLIIEAKAKACGGSNYYFRLKNIDFLETSLKDKLGFPYSKEDFTFIDYPTFYKDDSESILKNLKNNYLRGQEEISNSKPDIVLGPSCMSSLSFDDCFCYPTK